MDIREIQDAGRKTGLPGAVQAAKRAGHRGFLHELVKNRALFVMILPAMLFFLIFSYIPISGIYLAFTNFNFADGFWKSPFCGLANFRFLFSSGTALNITKNTLAYNVAFIIFGSATSILAAIFLSEIKGKVFKKITHTIMFLPYFISFVLVAAFVYNIFNYDFGITGIDESIFEAAIIDGADIFQKIRHITLPHILPTFVLILIFNVGSIMRGQFDLFYNIIGSNSVLYDVTDIIDTYVYRSLVVNFDMGMASAAGVYQSVVGLVIVLSFNAFIRKIQPDYALF